LLNIKVSLTNCISNMTRYTHLGKSTHQREADNPTSWDELKSTPHKNKNSSKNGREKMERNFQGNHSQGRRNNRFGQGPPAEEVSANFTELGTRTSAEDNTQSKNVRGLSIIISGITFGILVGFLLQVTGSRRWWKYLDSSGFHWKTGRDSKLSPRHSGKKGSHERKSWKDFRMSDERQRRRPSEFETRRGSAADNSDMSWVTVPRPPVPLLRIKGTHSLSNNRKGTFASDVALQNTLPEDAKRRYAYLPFIQFWWV